MMGALQVAHYSPGYLAPSWPLGVLLTSRGKELGVQTIKTWVEHKSAVTDFAGKGSGGGAAQEKPRAHNHFWENYTLGSTRAPVRIELLESRDAIVGGRVLSQDDPGFNWLYGAYRLNVRL